jgi:xylulokinase
VIVSKEVIVGLDVGTSSVKALFISSNGEVIDRIESKITTHHETGSIAEQDANDYWRAVIEIFGRAGSIRNDVVAIGLSGQTPSVVCVDEFGNPTYPVLIWQDARATSEAAELAEHFGNPVPVVGTSLPWSASACAAKLMWLARHEPKVVAKTRWVLQPKDFVGFKLTSTAISDPWSSKGLCNVLTKAAIPSVFEFVGWNAQVTPELLDGTASRGRLTSLARSELGLLNPDIEVSVGLSDAMCGMLSIGAFTEPKAFVITGTSAIVGISTEQQVSDAAGLYVIPKTCAPLNVVYGPTQSSGASVQWVANLFSISIDQAMDCAQDAQLNLVPIFLPYISGERAPIWRTDIRGAFGNVDAAATRNEFCAGVLQGISFAERSVLDAAAKTLKSSYSAVTLGGHAGNDQRWDAFRLRTLGTNLVRKTDIDSTTRGSAMLGLALLGGSLADSVQALAPTSESSAPLEADIQYSTRNYQAFCLLRDSTLKLIDNRN